MYRIDATIEGVAPILFSRWTETESLDGGAKKSVGRGDVRDARIEEALLKVYRTAAGELGIPAWNLKKCLLEGCQKAGLKEGRGSMTPYLAATIFIDGEPSFGVREADGIHEQPGRRPPRTGGAMLIRRPMLRAGWTLPFTLNVLDDRRAADSIRRALEEAGVLVGLGSWRPEFGRFVVTAWDVVR